MNTETEPHESNNENNVQTLIIVVKLTHSMLPDKTLQNSYFQPL